MSIAGTRLGTVEASRAQLEAERAAVDAMLTLAEKAATRPDARIRWLENWMDSEMLADGCWTDRRLLIFTEYEATRLYIQRQIERILMDLPDYREQWRVLERLSVERLIFPPNRDGPLLQGKGWQ